MRKLKVGVWQAVFCATLAVSPYVLMMAVGGSTEVLSGLIKEVGFEILSGLLVLYLCAVVLGGNAGRRIERGIQNKLLCCIIGIGLAVSFVLAAILAGALAALIREAVTVGAEIALGHTTLYLVRVPAYIMLYAALPAAGLGVLYTILVVITVRRHY